MFSLNRAEVIGNLTRDPELRTIPSGQTVCSFAVATNRRWKDKDGNTKEDTQYHEINIWGRLGELAGQMLSKGKKVYVEGRLQTSSWEGNDGIKRSKTEIVAENFIPLSPKGDSTGFDMSEMKAATSEEDPKGDIGQKPAEGSPDSTSTEDKKSKDKKSGDSDEINLDDIPF
jgi:single-strand DNA-binding protein